MLVTQMFGCEQGNHFISYGTRTRFDASNQLSHPFALYANTGETLVLYRARRKRNDRAMEKGLERGRFGGLQGR